MERKVNWLKNHIRRYSFYSIALLLSHYSIVHVQAMDMTPPKLSQDNLERTGVQHECMVEPSFHDLALMEYITAKNVAGVRETLKSPVQINLSCAQYHGHTPLSEAVATNNTEIVDLVLGHPQIDIDTDADRGYRAVHIAALQSQAVMVSKLCARGASLALLNDEGNTPLHEAVQHKENDFACVYNLISVVPDKRLEQLVKLESLALHFFRCCFKDKKSVSPCGLGGLPKDVRFLICGYYLRTAVSPRFQRIVQAMLQKRKIDLDLLIEFQLEYLQPIFETKNNHDWTPHELLWKDQPNYFHLRNILNPKERSCRRLAIEKYIKEASTELNLSSKLHNSEQSQTQPIADRASVTM